MLSIRPILQTLEPDETGLVLALAQRLSDRDRHWIANDNYGDDDGEARLAIDEVLRTGRVAGALNGDARCAMEFGRWSDPEGQEAAGSVGLANAHASRLFTSAVIMQLLGKGDGDGGEVESLAGLDGALLRCDGASEHQVLFRDTDRNQRDAKWRALLTQAYKRGNQRTAASRQDLDDDTVDRFTWLLEKALETPSAPPRVD